MTAKGFECGSCEKISLYTLPKNSQLVVCPHCNVTSRTEDPCAYIVGGIFLIFLSIIGTVAILSFTHSGFTIVPVGLIVCGIRCMCVGCKLSSYPRSDFITLQPE